MLNDLLCGDQLDLLPATQQEKPKPPPRLVPLTRGFRDPYEPFCAEGCLEILQQLGADGEWMDWFEICAATKMYPADVSALCRCLVKAGTLEAEDRYWCSDRMFAPNGYLTGADVPTQLVRAGKYQGFQTAYRLRMPHNARHKPRGEATSA